MPNTSLPDLSTFAPDLHWLIHLEPTYDALARDARPSGFSVCNVFSVPDSAPLELRAHDIAGGHLLDGADEDELYKLLHCDPPFDPVMVELRRQLRSGEIQSGFGPADPAEIDALEQRERLARQERVKAANEICDNLARQWHRALVRYDQVRAGQPPPVDGRRSALYLEPCVELPAPDLVRRLDKERDIARLMLLTARHELGSIYKTVMAWQVRAQSGRRIDPNDNCLTPWHAGLLSARARGRHFWTLSLTNDTLLRRRNDALVENIESQCHLSQLYTDLSQWCKATYEAVITIPTCNRQGCGNPKRLRADGKGWRPYCSDECADEQRRATYRESSKEYRKSIKRPKGTSRAQRVNNSQQ